MRTKLYSLLATSYLFSLPALATGLGFWESSATVSALGGANGALAIDASALALNPSSIAQFERSVVTAGFSHYEVVTNYNLFGDETEIETGDVIPAGFLAMPIADNWHFGLAIYSRNAADITIPRIAVLSETNVQPITVSVAPSLVYSQADFSLGITLEYLHGAYRLWQERCFPFIGCSDFNQQGEVNGWSGGLSGTYHFNDNVSIAATYKFATQFGDENIDFDLPSVSSVFVSYAVVQNFNLHGTYSHSAWEDKGVVYNDYSDPVGLLVGVTDSTRYAVGAEYDWNRFKLMAGVSLDEAIDPLGGSDVRYRLGAGYDVSDSVTLNGVVVIENYATKQAQVSGETLVKVQNDGTLLGLSASYRF
jgi:long-subunit fatty acid transport protein